MSETFEALGYFAGAWLFLFSKRFRSAWLEEFAGEGILGRTLMSFNAAVAVVVGFGLPVALLVWVSQ